MARFLVTGGCGFIGAHLCASLLADHHGVVVLDDLSLGAPDAAPSGAQVEAGSVTDAHLVGEVMEQVDGCFHLAAIEMPEDTDWHRRLRTNVFGTLTVLDAARRVHPDQPIPVIYASSAEVYGEGVAQPVTERSPTVPQTVMGVDKLACEHYAATFARSHRIPCAGLRLFEVYGPAQADGHPAPGIVDAFAQALAEQREIVLPGDGGQMHDLVAVDDVVRLFRAAMARPPLRPDVFNACTGTATSLMELAELMGRLLDGPPDYRFVPAKCHAPRAMIGSPAKALEYFGWSPTIPLPHGLESMLAAMRMIEWY